MAITVGRVKVETVDRSETKLDNENKTVAIVTWELKRNGQELKTSLVDNNEELTSNMFNLCGNFFKFSIEYDGEFKYYMRAFTSPLHIESFVSFNNIGKSEVKMYGNRNEWLYDSDMKTKISKIWNIKESITIEMKVIRVGVNAAYLEIGGYEMSKSMYRLLEMFKSGAPSDLTIAVSKGKEESKGSKEESKGLEEENKGLEEKNKGLKEFKVHKNVIEIQSEYFAMLKTKKMDEYNSGRLILADIDPLIFGLVLDFLYTENIDFKKLDGKEFTDLCKEDFVLDLYIAADRFIIPELKSKMLKLVDETMTMQNIVSRFNYTRSREIPELKKACVDYLKSIPACAKTNLFLSQCFGIVIDDVVLLRHMLYEPPVD